MSEHFTSDAQEAALAHYRPFSALAVVGLLLSVVSVVAFWHPLLWCVPVVAVLVNAIALRRIAHFGSEAAGRGAAIVGLGLSLVVGVAAPTRHQIIAAVQRADARKLGMQWFAHLADGEPQMAAQLRLEPLQRKLPGEDVWVYYRDLPDGPEQMKQFVADPAVRNLLALGRDAQVRYSETEVEQQTAQRATIVQLYTITFQRDGRPTTFFVRLLMHKQLRGPSAGGGWWIARADLVTTPPESWPDGDADT